VLSLLKHQQDVVYAFFIVLLLSVLAYFATRKAKLIPSGLQNAAEIFIETLDDFIQGMLGSQSRKYLPFIGTLFLYILFMNLTGFVPFMKSATSSLSTTLALALCVFFYVLYSGIRKMGLWGYIDHVAGRPRGILALTIIFPIFSFCIHFVSELLRPVSLSLRLRSNIWGDDILLALLTSFGWVGFPMLFLNTLMALLTAFIQAMVFTLLSVIYFAMAVTEEE
jgi:F-type H+-transporting ATPase subunit a